MKILNITAQPGYTLLITSTDGRTGLFDVSPYMGYETFAPLKELAEFVKVRNGGYFIEWDCGADLSADTLEARMIEARENTNLSFRKSGTEKAGVGETAPHTP